METLLPFRQMAIFATVVERGSMRAAAGLLGMTPSAVSQQLRALEVSLDVALLHRSTRRLTLTEAGTRYLQGCTSMLAAARGANDALASLRDAPEGELRLAAPVGFANLIARALGPLLAAHPRLSMHLLLDDAATDLIAERIDLALRVGEWADSSLVARRIGTMKMIIVAAPAYVGRHGVPATPQELLTHEWLMARPNGPGGRALTLIGPSGQTSELRPQARVYSNNHPSMQLLCLAGLGVAALAPSDVAGDLEAGRLVRLLPGWQSAAMPVHAVTPRRDAQPAKVRYALAALTAVLQAWDGDSAI